jgi:hypothetical protein
MTKDQILARIDAVLLQASPSHQAGYPTEQMVNGALTIMLSLYGEGSAQVQSLLKRRDDPVIQKWAPGPRKAVLCEAVTGVLQNARQEIQGGLLTSLERRIASDVLSDLVQLSREALKDTGDGAKNVAAVLAAAAYEDTIRRIAREHAGVIGQDKLDTVITKLKDAGLLVAPQLPIALSYLSFRNHALHANWDKIERAAVESVLGFVEQLLLKHF